MLLSNEPAVLPSLQLLSVGLLRQEMATENGSAPSAILLDESFRQGWERLSYLCVQMGVLPPHTLPELVLQLYKPVSQWPGIGAGLPPDQFNAPLLEADGTSVLCTQLGVSLLEVNDVVLELEDEFFRRLFHCCLELGDTGQYSLAREFINRCSVLDDFYMDVAGNMEFRDEVRPLLATCYEPIPPGCIQTDHDGAYILLCPHCGWTLEREYGELICFRGGPCAQLYGDLQVEALRRSYTPEMARTKEGVQRYVSAPEKSLMRLVDSLSKQWGLSLSLYPEFDAYDLLIQFISGPRWAVDLKAHRRAVRLALTLTPFRYQPPWDSAFYVFPDYRADASGYLAEFRNYWTPQKDVYFMGVREFLRRVNQELSR